MQETSLVEGRFCAHEGSGGWVKESLYCDKKWLGYKQKQCLRYCICGGFLSNRPLGLTPVMKKE
ncbi:hypothetical protein HCH_00474 [Hahella chejuensis KCTC 2396]|uniref:Uncharacterized protein n=1 Tax=Hahella chejuensis (strain KCTC 2396) TaxID=349521 RepID=Q2SPP1_HAHCH|nr:hypothetical protein [Hahella chejuensis]ABC27383.1 hypothetical protein HCH_00474 [Hahella chejuensis KCTC 2396]